MPKAIVTGGAGFIGSHLVERLLNENFEVTVLDNLATGQERNLSAVRSNKRLHFVKVDLNSAKIKSHFKGAQYVFHLAALADVVPSIQNPVAYFEANVRGTVSALEASRDAKAERFVYIASSSCYGIPTQFPTPETADPKPQYPYALTKYLGESITMHWAQVYKIPCVSLRLFNVYGPRARSSGTYGAVFGVFLAQKLAGKPFTVVGDGKQTRDFTYVSDVVDAIFRASRSNVHAEIFNVGSGKPESVNRLVELLGGDVVHLPKRPGEPDCTFADTHKIERMLNWKSKVPFEHGVKTLLDQINSWKDAPVWDESSIEEATKTWFQYLGEGTTASLSE
jgi:UDP-glucose 4-epimerase